MPVISVIVPVYKVEKYLDKCVYSIINQTFIDFELFLVDDGSPDNCPKMCDEWAKKDSRIIVIHKENGGLSDARNVALDRACGEYICFVDSDDYIANDSLESLYTSIKSTDSDISIGNLIYTDDDGKEISTYRPYKDENTVITGDRIFETLNLPCAPNRLYKVGIFNELRYPKGRLYEDVFVWHKILAQTERIVFTGKDNYYYLVRQNSIMHSEYNIRFTDIIDAIKERYDWLESIGQYELSQEALLFLYTRVSVAVANLDEKDEMCKKRKKEVYLIYKECYGKLMSDKSIGTSQKIRFALLRFFPSIHTKLFGKKMPVALG